MTVVAALRSRLGRGAVTYAPGSGRVIRDYDAVPARQLRALRGEYWDNIGLDGPLASPLSSFWPAGARSRWLTCSSRT
ncbi:MAG: hypothetical protein E6H78_15960 [Betaproteobacteria bacterium]|nr:MAG: hypothetical protein E6H78_15960 [Betaproteobacteria bacterium]